MVMYFQVKLRKLNEAQVKEIRKRAENGETAYKIAKDFDVSWKAVRRIVLGLTYKDCY